MRLLQLTLDGTYKGLSNQVFDFRQTKGSILAFIGLNGSGKSQLMELIAETFAYLERWQRDDFITRTGIPYSVQVDYETKITPFSDELSQYRVKILQDGSISVFPIGGSESTNDFYSDPLPLPEFIVGYSSGLNENLQRPFMKNAVQYYDIYRIRHNRNKEASRENVTQDEILEINRKYQLNYSHIFSLPGSSSDLEGLEKYLVLSESDTALPQMVYMDYDSNVLLLVALSILTRGECASLFPNITHSIPSKVTLRYDLRGGMVQEDAVRDIKQLVRAGGADCITGIGKSSTDIEFDQYGLDYLAGEIRLDFTNTDVQSSLIEDNYNEPITLFKRLYKMQLLGVKNWLGTTRQLLRKDNFLDTVKKPLKSKLPLSVKTLELENLQGETISYDDLSDGESQLMHVLAAAHIFKDTQTLFLFDEPETHLNPAWRTHFHQYFKNAITPTQQTNIGCQALISTHSPFMISSLQKEDVFSFTRQEDRSEILMTPASEQTYGASFDVLIKQHFGLRSLVSQTVVQNIKEHLPSDDNPEKRVEARRWLEENLGESMEILGTPYLIFRSGIENNGI